MRNAMLLARATTLTLLTVIISGCMGVKVVAASIPAASGPPLERAPAGARIALHVAVHNPTPGVPQPAPLETGIRNKFQSQLAALGYHVISPAEATPQDLLLRVDSRDHAMGGESMTIIFSIFSAFILPSVAGEFISIDTSLIREGELLGTSRQMIKTRSVFGVLPVGLLFGKMESPALYEEHVQLNTGLLSLATPTQGRGI